MSVIPTTLQLAATSGLEAMCNRLIDMDAGIATKLSPLNNKAIHVHLDGPDLDLYFLPNDGHINIQTMYEGKTTTSVQGKPSDFVELMVAKDPASTLINGDIKVMGETRALMALQQAFRGSDLDWDYELSKVVGDIAAHEIGKVARKTMAWLKAGPKGNVKDQLESYVKQQTLVLPSREEIDSFCRDVDSLASRTERLEALLRQQQNS